MKLTKTILRNPPEGHIQTRRATLLPARRFRVWRRGSRAKGQDTRARAPRGGGAGRRSRPRVSDVDPKQSGSRGARWASMRTPV